MSIFEELNISGDFTNHFFLIHIQPLEFSDVLQKDHNFSVFGHDQFMGFVRGSDVSGMNVSENLFISLISLDVVSVIFSQFVLFGDSFILGNFLSVGINKNRVFIFISWNLKIMFKIYMVRKSHLNGDFAGIRKHFLIIGGNGTGRRSYHLYIVHLIPTIIFSCGISLTEDFTGVRGCKHFCGWNVIGCGVWPLTLYINRE